MLSADPSTDSRSCGLAGCNRPSLLREYRVNPPMLAELEGAASSSGPSSAANAAGEGAGTGGELTAEQKRMQKQQ